MSKSLIDHYNKLNEKVGHHSKLILLIIVVVSLLVIASIKSGILTYSKSYDVLQAKPEIHTPTNKIEMKEISSVPQKSKIDSTHKAILACGDSGFLYNSGFTSKITNREPVDKIVQASSSRKSVFFFSYIGGSSKTNIIHKWSFNGKPIASVNLKVGSQRWRTWSSKNLNNKKGTWKVSVLDDKNCLLGSSTIIVADTDKFSDSYITGLHSPESALLIFLKRSQNEMTFSKEKVEFFIGDGRNGFTKTTSYKTGSEDAITKFIQGDKAIPGDYTYYRSFINRRNQKGETPLIEAIKLGHTKRIYELLRKGALTFIRDDKDKTAIEYAHEFDLTNVEDAIYKAMIKKEVTSKNNIVNFLTKSIEKDRLDNGDTALLAAIGNGDEQAVRNILGDLVIGKRLGLTVRVYDAGANLQQEFQKERLSKSKRMSAAKGGALYQYNYLGKLPIEIAKEKGFWGIERLLDDAMDANPPPWAVSRAVSTSSMINGKPQNCLRKFIADTKTAYYYSEHLGMKGKTIIHRWKHTNGKTEEFVFPLKTNAESIFSKQDIASIDLGAWTITIETYEGLVLMTERLTKTYSEDKIGTRARDIDICQSYSSILYKLANFGAPIPQIDKYMNKLNGLEKKTEASLMLHIAVNTRNVILARYALRMGANLEMTDKKTKLTPFLGAVDNNDLLMAFLLNKSGANINAINSKTRDGAIHISTRKHNHTMVEFLLNNGVNVDTLANGKQSALSLAAGTCDTKAVNLLLKHKANTQIKNYAGLMAKDNYIKKCGIRADIGTLELLNQ